ncbi:MAG: ribonuclease HI [Pyrinomonadaceae bacterium]
MKKVTIVCDGSSLGNGKVSARAAAVALLGFEGVWKAVGEYLGAATNQQAEIAAAAVGLESLNQPCTVTLMSDSRYVIETMGGTWKRKTNHNWWARLDRASEKHEITWKWVRGHDGHVVQEVADDLARKTAELRRVDPTLLDEAAADLGVVEIG